MRIYFNQLTPLLAKPLAAVWLIFGDEPWQKNSSLDKLKQAASQQGFEELIRFSGDDKFDWQQVIDECQSLSLFAARRIIEIDISAAKINEKAATVLIQLASLVDGSGANDILLILHGGKLDASNSRKKWFKALEKDGVYLPLYDLDKKGLRIWLQQRCQHYQLRFDDNCQSILIDFYEGNLPALDQELQKLQILYGSNNINSEELALLLSKHAKFNPFQLIDSLLSGQLPQTLAMLSQLEHQGVAAAQIIWLLHKEINQLLAMHEVIKEGGNQQQLWKQFKIWEKRKPVYQNALAHISPSNAKIALKRLAQTDLISKTSSEFNPYILLADVCACLYHGERLTDFSLNLEFHD
jgi:DNA polymerase-3 subunit delta